MRNSAELGLDNKGNMVISGGSFCKGIIVVSRWIEMGEGNLSSGWFNLEQT